MEHMERYEDAVRRLADHGYSVTSDRQGYIVRHLTNPDDVSHADNLDQLVELSDLFDWREQRQRPLKSEPGGSI